MRQFLAAMILLPGAGVPAGTPAPAQEPVGDPAIGSACAYPDGTLRPVYAGQRRWFSEVLR